MMEKSLIQGFHAQLAGYFDTSGVFGLFTIRLSRFHGKVHRSSTQIVLATNQVGRRKLLFK